MGTVPIGTGLAAMIAWRISSMLPPVLRSMTVSAPYFSANLSFSNSPSTSEVTAELPMFALIFTAATVPIPIGCEPLPLGDVGHLGGNDAVAGVVHLRRALPICVAGP